MKNFIIIMLCAGLCLVANYADIKLSTFAVKKTSTNDSLIADNESEQSINLKSNKGSVDAIKSQDSSLFGQFVYIFDESQGDSEIQKKINTIYNQQLNNHFGDQHYALLFKPGIYHVDVKVGYYTQVLGLGGSPDDVTIIGAVRTEDDPNTQPVDQGPGALNNFWRSIENVSIIPTLGSLNQSGKGIAKDENVWAVSQAAPMRNIHIKEDKTLSSSGSLRLFDMGWASGGYMANSKVDGHVEAGTQQQWFSRNSEWNQWQHGNWNIVDVGSKFVIPVESPKSNVPKNAWDTYPFTIIPLTPVIAEKPTLIMDKNDKFSVFIPELSINSSGINWGKGSAIPLSQFYVATPHDSAEKINKELQQEKNILFTPGVYELSEALYINYPSTILLGIGLPSLSPMNGTQAIIVSDVSGVKIAGLMIDAGPVTSPTLVQIGETTSKNDHSADPTMLYDIFCRVGGLSSEVTKTESCIVLNSN
ncbi:MAG: hypothetical protein H0X29_05285, partial [Parachlamydiaceae bacterium]|nr:hypothetical protein [Parachlamydiaceae bacterium]